MTNMLDELPKKDFENTAYKCQKTRHARDPYFETDIPGVALKDKTISGKKYRLTVWHYIYYSQYNFQKHYREGKLGIETFPCSF